MARREWSGWELCFACGKFFLLSFSITKKSSLDGDSAIMKPCRRLFFSLALQYLLRSSLHRSCNISLYLLRLPSFHLLSAYPISNSRVCVVCLKIIHLENILYCDVLKERKGLSFLCGRNSMDAIYVDKLLWTSFCGHNLCGHKNVIMFLWTSFYGQNIFVSIYIFLIFYKFLFY